MGVQVRYDGHEEVVFFAGSESENRRAHDLPRGDYGVVNGAAAATFGKFLLGFVPPGGVEKSAENPLLLLFAGLIGRFLGRGVRSSSHPAFVATRARATAVVAKSLMSLTMSPNRRLDIVHL